MTWRFYIQNNDFLVKTKFGRTLVPFVTLSISPYEITSVKYAFTEILYLLWVYKNTVHNLNIYLFPLCFLQNSRLRTGQNDETFVPFVTMWLFFFPMISMNWCLGIKIDVYRSKNKNHNHLQYMPYLSIKCSIIYCE